jgi:alginate O-acetyltransferase complex protein AlgI
MQFQSEGFIFLFLPLAIFLSFVPGYYFRSLSLILLSYAFYSSASPFFVILLAVSSATAYAAGLLLDQDHSDKRRKLILFLAITANLSMLGYFKYIFFFSDSVHYFGTFIGMEISLERFAPSSALDYILPAGISFYTFQALAYVIDVYRRDIRAEKDILIFFGFVSFWPQLVAGPIERYNILGPQIRAYAERKLADRYWVAGIDRFSLGVIQKIILAEGCGTIIDQLSNNITEPDMYTSWIIALGFGMQIFFDFVAYTNMAIGAAAILGFRISENFFSPYRARSIRDFWHGWHVTLSIWFRDYVYIPLGGSRRGFIFQLRNVFILFLITGLWHGAGWNFVIWGLMHGLMLIVYLIYKRLLPKFEIPGIIAFVVTFLLVQFAWVPFRFADISEVKSIWTGMIGLNGFTYPAGLNPWDVTFILVATFLSIALPNSSKRWPGSSGLFESVALWVGAALALIYAPEVSNFIYFQF